jgi:sugar phosphate permease
VFVVAVAGYTAVTFAQGAMADWFPSFLVRNPDLGMDVGKAGMLVGASAVVGGLAGTTLGGWLADKLIGHTRHPYLALSAGSMVFAILSTLAALRLGSATGVIAAMFFAQFFLWFYNGPINALIANSTGGELRARAFALSILSIHLLGDSISPTIVGKLSDTLEAAGDVDHLGTSLLLIPAAMLVGTLIWAWGWRRLPAGAA